MVYHCVEVSYTREHRKVRIIFPQILHTIIIAQMLSTGGKRKSQLCIEWHLHSVMISLTCDYLLHVLLHPLEGTAVRCSTHSRIIKCSVDRFSTRLQLFYWRLFINDENTSYHSTLRPLLNISQSHITITRTAQNTHCLLGILKSICFPASPDQRVSYPFQGQFGRLLHMKFLRARCTVWPPAAMHCQ